MFRKLSYSQRQQIEQLLGQGQSQSAIARAIGVHRSTVKRELERNSQEGKYTAFNAHCIGVARKVLTGKLVAIKRKLLKNRQHRRNYRWLARTSTLYSPPAKEDLRKRDFKPKHRYFRKKDLRREWEHPHLYRSLSYYSWKSYWEQNYYLRDHQREEALRRPRTARDWRNYRYQKRRGIFAMTMGRSRQRVLNALWRSRVERRLQLRRMEEYKALIAQNRLKQQLKEVQPPSQDIIKEQFPTLSAPSALIIPLRRERHSPELLWALPPPAG